MGQAKYAVVLARLPAQKKTERAGTKIKTTINEKLFCSARNIDGSSTPKMLDVCQALAEMHKRRIVPFFFVALRGRLPEKR